MSLEGRKAKDQVKLLGIQFSSNWNFRSQVNSIISRTSFRMLGLSRIKDFLSKKHLKNLLDSLVISVIRRGLEFTAISNDNLKRLQKVQNRALRIATDSSNDERISRKETGWLSVMNLFRLQQIPMVDVIKENQTCLMCTRIINLEKNQHQRNYDLRLREL